MQKIFIAIFLLFSVSLFAQKDTIIIDQIIARVGDEIVLQSEVEADYYQWLASGNSASRNAKCHVLEAQLIQKLLLNQAKLDSIELTDDELDMQVDGRLAMYKAQFGGETEMEEYLNKSIFDIKADLRKALKNQIIADKMKNKITEDVKLTPADVSDYYHSLSRDSLPLIDVTYEVRQICVYPQMTDDEEKITLDKLNEIREKIVSGKRRFESMARIYSEDPMSAKSGGELGFFARAELDPSFSSTAFRLQKDEVSKIVKSKFGYHIIQLIERRGEKVNVRHILVRPIVPASAKKRAIAKCDSLLEMIHGGEDFKDVAMEFSEDKNTRNNGGLVFNQAVGSTKFSVAQLPQHIKYDIMNMENGEMSKTVETVDDVGNVVFKIYYIESKKPAHVANMKDDYHEIQRMAVQYKKESVFREWIYSQQKEIYISIDKQYSDCQFDYRGWFKN